jgi:magnesium transporter
LIWSVIIGSIIYLWFGELGISIVLGIAILGNLIAGVSSGVLTLSMLNKLKLTLRYQV